MLLVERVHPNNPNITAMTTSPCKAASRIATVSRICDHHMLNIIITTIIINSSHHQLKNNAYSRWYYYYSNSRIMLNVARAMTIMSP